MEREVALNKICEFLNAHDLSVVATVHAHQSGAESAVVGYCNTDNLELIFGTSNTSRKYANISKNPHVSFIVGWSSKDGSLQYEGIAHQLGTDEQGPYIDLLITRNQGHAAFAHNADQVYFLVQPLWIRFSDNAATPPHVYEITFR